MVTPSSGTHTATAHEGASSQVLAIPVALVEPNPNQVRRNAEREKADETAEQGTIEDLASSIREHGLIQPILVIPHPDPSKPEHFQIVSGERRYRAVASLGWTAIPAIVDQGLAQDEWRRKAIELVENTQRRSLDWFDKARRLAELTRERPDLTQRALAQQLGIPPARYSIYLAIGSPTLEPVTLAAIQLGLFTEIHAAYHFLALPATRKTSLLSAAQRKLESGAPLKDVQLSRRKLEALREAADKPSRAKPEPATPPVAKISLPALPEPLVRRLFARLNLSFPDGAPGQVGARLIAALDEPEGAA